MTTEHTSLAGVERMADGAEVQRALIVHMLHQLIELRAKAVSVRSLFDYTCMNAGTTDQSQFVTPTALDLTIRGMDESITQVTLWLRAQVVCLHDPLDTTERTKGTPPPMTA